MSKDSQPRVLVTPEELVGFEIDGRYRLDGILGGGGMGVVYRTTQQNLRREIAIKVLKIDEADEKHRLERFRREIDIIASLSHPNIVRVFDSGRDPLLGLHYIAMELVEGAALDDVMHGYRVKPELALDIAYEVAAALTEPHKMGIVHRDIKPANVLITPRSDDTVGVKVVDFGIARTSASDGSSKITTTGVVVGSPMYMAPEVARGESLDGRTDLYSLGVVIYEMVTGTTPFSGSTPVAIMLRHAVEDPPSLAEAVGPDFRIPELVDLVDAMLSKDPRKRPADAKQVLRTLDEIRTAYALPRVRIDSTQPVRDALRPFLVATTRVEAPLDEPDPYSATTPIGVTENRKSGDSFSGWLISGEARAALAATSRLGALPPLPPETDDETDDEPAALARPRWPVALAGAAVVFGVALAAWWATHEPPDANAEPEQLGTTPIPAVAPPPVAPPTLPTIAAASADAGPLPDAADPRDAAVPAPAAEPAPKPPSKPDRRPAQPPPAGDEFQKGMEWLHQK